MLTRPQVQRYSAESGLRDLMIAENEVVLTYLLQLMAERGILERLAFKGGTCIRKILGLYAADSTGCLPISRRASVASAGFHGHDVLSLGLQLIGGRYEIHGHRFTRSKESACTLLPPFVNARDILVRPSEVMRQFVNHDMRDQIG